MNNRKWERGGRSEKEGERLKMRENKQRKEEERDEGKEFGEEGELRRD